MSTRKAFIKNNLLGLTGIMLIPGSVSALIKQNRNSMELEKIDPEMVKEFVGNCHGNLSKVQELYEKQPRLIFASHDWGAGDFENGIEAAGHMGNKEIADFLLSKGARINFFTMCMLGKTEAVKNILKDFPEMVNAKGPHGFTPMHHALVGGKASEDIKAILMAAGASEDKLLL
jgi:hypothetical protein